MRGAVFLSHDDDTSLFPFSILYMFFLFYEIYVQRAEWIEVDIIIVEWEWTFFLCDFLVGGVGIFGMSGYFCSLNLMRGGFGSVEFL
jgi:hypothetical protein